MKFRKKINVKLNYEMARKSFDQIRQCNYVLVVT